MAFLILPFPRSYWKILFVDIVTPVAQVDMLFNRAKVDILWLFNHSSTQ